MDKLNKILQTNKLVLIDFYADWCGPCKMIAPVIEEIAKENEGLVKVIKLDVDKETSAAQHYKIMSIPTLVIVKDGKKVNELVGYRSKKDILVALGL